MKRIIFATLALTFLQVNIFGMDTVVGGEPGTHSSVIIDVDTEEAANSITLHKAVAAQKQIDIAAHAIACNLYAKRVEEAGKQLLAMKGSTELPATAVTAMETTLAQLHQKYVAAMATIQTVVDTTKVSHELLTSLAQCVNDVEIQREEYEQREKALVHFEAKTAPLEKKAQAKKQRTTKKLNKLRKMQNKFNKLDPRRYAEKIPCTRTRDNCKHWTRKILGNTRLLESYAADRLQLETARNTAKGKLDTLLSTLAGLVSMLPKEAAADTE